MTQKEVIEYMSERLQKSKAETRRILLQFSGFITSILDKDRSVYLPGLGTFKTKIRKKRKSYHPQKKQMMMLPPKRVLAYKAGKPLQTHFQEKETQS